MEIKEIEKEKFDEYGAKHVLGSFYQTSTYGTLMSKYGYRDLYIGVYNGDVLIGASLILTKNMDMPHVDFY